MCKIICHKQLYTYMDLFTRLIEHVICCDIFDTTLGRLVSTVDQYVISCVKPVREFLDLLSLLCHRLPLLPWTILLCHIPSHVLSELSLVAGLYASIHTLPSFLLIAISRGSHSDATKCNSFTCIVCKACCNTSNLVGQAYVKPF